MNTGEKERAQQRADQISARISVPTLNKIANRAISEKTPGQKIVWLRQLGDALNHAAQNVGPCSSGCSHCCYIPLLITATEAQQIANDTNTPLHKPQHTIEVTGHGVDAQSKDDNHNRHNNTPCPFLKNNLCSIYPFRPFACRVHISLADSVEPCKNPGKPGLVPYLNHAAYHMAFTIALKEHALHIADIREFFRPT